MKNLRLLIFIILVSTLISVPNYAQFSAPGLGGGVGIGATLGHTDFKSNEQVGSIGRAFLRLGFVNHFQLELGGAVGVIANDEYRTDIKPIDLRLLISPFSMESVNPYIYGGFGYMRYDLESYPVDRTPDAKLNGWMGFIPAGLGFQFALVDNIALELTAGYNLTLEDNLDAMVRGSDKDGFFTATFGVSVTGEDPNGDPDGDGLTNKEEKQLGTNPNKADTDGDGLNDGEEVLKYKTNPLNKDTDGGSVDDFTEVKRGTDPLNADDDVVKLGVPIVLEGITFATGKADITPESEATLQKALKTLTTYPDISLEISGYTDNVGNDKSNQILSEKRANAVRDWLISKGISGDRINAVGYGEQKPIAPNDTPENRQKNRRIEFTRTK